MARAAADGIRAKSPPTQRLLGSAWPLQAWAEVKEMDTHPLGVFLVCLVWVF